MRRHVLPAVLAIAYAVAVVIAAWRAPDKGFQAFLGRRIVHVERGALHEGEVIERIDGAPVASTLDYAFRVLGRAPGETVRIGTRDHDETIVLAASKPPWWGFVATLLAAVLLGAGIVARRARPEDAHAKRFFRAAFVYAIVFVGALSWTKLIVHPVLAVGFLLALFAGPGVALDLALGLGTGGRRAQRVLMAMSAGLALVCGVALVRAVTDRSSDGALAWVVGCIAAQIALLPVHTLVGLWAELRAHRSATGEARAQLRWMVFGHALSALPILAAVPFALAGLDRFLIFTYQPFTIASAVGAFFGYGLAVLRVRLGDVDALIGHAFATSAAVVAFVGVVLAAGWGTAQIAPGPWGYLVAGVAAAAAFGPLRARVTGWIDRRFFRDRQHYVEALRQASESLARLREPAQLAREAVELVVAAVRAERGALYVRRPREPWTVEHAVGEAALEPRAPDGGVAIPVATGHTEPEAWLVLGPRKSGDLYSSQDRDLLGALASQLAVALANARAYGRIATMTRTLEGQKETLEAQNVEIRELRDKLEDENRFLRARVEAAGGSLIGDSKPMRELATTIERVGKTDATVLVLGETGTGKELVARALHVTASARAAPFVRGQLRGAAARRWSRASCSATSAARSPAPTRAQRGPLRGAPTAARCSSTRLASCRCALQAKLLRVLEEREFERVGGRPRRVDRRRRGSSPRPTATSPTMVDAGEFREDLYFRLRVVEIVVPPLRAPRRGRPAARRALLPRVGAPLGPSRLRRSPRGARQR